MVILTKLTRDRDGRMHSPGESLEIKTTRARVEHDERPLIAVKFSDGSSGSLFLDEITEQE